MKKLGIFIGIIFSVNVLLFGILWPNNLSNYFIYRQSKFETQLKSLQSQNAPAAQIQNLRNDFEAYQSSWQGLIANFLDLKSIGIVLGGSFSALLIAFPVSRTLAILRMLTLLYEKETSEEDLVNIYETTMQLATKKSSDQLLDEEDLASIENSYFRRWVEDFLLIDILSENMIKNLIEKEIQTVNNRCFEDIDVMNFLSKTAPAFGMVGTVVGLILLLSEAATSGGDIAGILGGMAIALLTTLYGVIITQVIFIPASSKMYHLKETQRKALMMAHDSIILLLRREPPETIGRNLVLFLSPKNQQRLEEERYAEE